MAPVRHARPRQPVAAPDERVQAAAPAAGPLQDGQPVLVRRQVVHRLVVDALSLLAVVDAPDLQHVHLGLGHGLAGPGVADEVQVAVLDLLVDECQVRQAEDGPAVAEVKGVAAGLLGVVRGGLVEVGVYQVCPAVGEFRLERHVGIAMRAVVLDLV